MYIASILMPVYNGERYLPEAIDSVLAQSFADFEFIIVDDGSTDNSPDIIRAYKDKRIRYIRLPQHMGISHALNHGLQYAEGELIFRMDADDFCFPQRIQCQINFMRQHPDVSICGSDTELIDEDGMVIGHRNVKEGDQRIKIVLFFGETSLAHPTVVMRKGFLKKHRVQYSESYLHAEDYELWCRCTAFCTFDNVPEALVQYRHHSHSVSKAYRYQQRVSAQKILVNHLRSLGLTPSPEELNCHMQFSLPLNQSDRPNRSELTMWGEKLLAWNSKNHVFAPDLFQVELEERYMHVYG